MKLRPITKIDKGNTATSKKLGDDVISANCDITDITLVNDQFGAIRKPDSGCMVCKTYISINSNLLSYKN